jgi:hypothetical protein
MHGATSDAEDEQDMGIRDAESEEIVKQLEKGLPRWEGFADVGWMEERHPVRGICLLGLGYGLTFGVCRRNWWTFFMPSNPIKM